MNEVPGRLCSSPTDKDNSGWHCVTGWEHVTTSHPHHSPGRVSGIWKVHNLPKVTQIARHGPGRQIYKCLALEPAFHLWYTLFLESRGIRMGLQKADQAGSLWECLVLPCTGQSWGLDLLLPSYRHRMAWGWGKWLLWVNCISCRIALRHLKWTTVDLRYKIRKVWLRLWKREKTKPKSPEAAL